MASVDTEVVALVPVLRRSRRFPFDHSTRHYVRKMKDSGERRALGSHSNGNSRTWRSLTLSCCTGVSVWSMGPYPRYCHGVADSPIRV